MYSGYTTGTLTLRAKGPFSYHHLSLYNDRVESCRWDCVPSAEFSIQGLPISPRFLYSYYLRQSTLIHWSPSRSFLSGGAAAGAQYCRLALHDRRPALSKERGRRGGSWASSRARDPDGSYGEMIGLLADVQCCYQEESSGFKCAGERSELGRSGRISEGEVKIKSVYGDCRRSLRRKDLGRARKDGSSSSVASSSVSGDSEPKGDRCRRVAGEYRNGYSTDGFEANRVDTVEKEVQEVRKYGDSAWLERRHASGQDVGWDTRGEFKRRESDGRATGSSSKKVSEWEIWDKKEKDASLMEHSHEAREGYIREVQPNVGQRDLREGQRDLREGSRKLTVTSEICEDGTKRTSNFKNMVDARKRSRDVSSATFVNRHSEIDQRAVGSTESRSSQKLNDKFEIHGSNIRRDSDSKKNLQETRLKERLDASTSVQNLVVAREKRIQPEQQAVDKVASNQQNKNRSNVSQIHESDAEKLSRLQILDESRLDDREYHPISAVHLVHGAREQQNQINERVNHQYSSRRTSEKNTRLSELSRSEIEGASNSQEISNSRVEHEGHSTSVINLIRGSREQQNRADDCVDSQYSSRGASERETKLSEFSSSKVERVSSSHGTSITRIGNQKQTSSVQDKKDKQKMTLSKEYSQSEKAQKEFTGVSDGSSSSLYKHIHELGDQTSRDVAYQSKDDKLESASRLDSSSALYVGEFVDMLRQEISTLVELDNTSNLSSEIRSEEVQERTSQTTTDIYLGVLDTATSSKDETYVQESARQSSSRSGVKGPSDEMWDVRGTYSQEPSRAKEHEDSSAVRVKESTTAPARTENSITRRTPRSLWTYIADIVRAGWGLRAESRNSTPKSGTRSSSNESVSSEAWFSGHEPDEKDDDETEKKGISSAPKGPVQTKRPVDPSHRRTLSVPSQGSSEASRPGDMRTLAEASSSTSTGSMKRNQPSKGASPVSKPVEFQWTEGEKGRQGIPSSVVTIDQSSASTGGTVSSTVEEVITEIGNAQTAGGSFLKLEEELVRGKPPEVGLTDGKDGELKRRKLQRNKQVLKEQFDEWEEAYNREKEQRKMDEYFMREALLEAKKAADTWEVPVGAVLVKNGNIIARGCNLVEELRDSTAHAEMICIREASNLLRTWRLAETTLYVTLEPCAMCAGAILQARIDTVVWGAPNRLLGADGSWVRLFPGEHGGSNDLDPSNPRAGPVHPFHPKMTIRRGILATECSDVMQRFFQLRRKKKMEPPPPPPPPSCLPISTHPSKLVTKMHNIFSTMFCL